MASWRQMPRAWRRRLVTRSLLTSLGKMWVAKKKLNDERWQLIQLSSRYPGARHLSPPASIDAKRAAIEDSVTILTYKCDCVEVSRGSAGYYFNKCDLQIYKHVFK